MSAGGIEAQGKLALVAEKGGRADAYLVAGTSLHKGGVRLSAERASYEGVLTGAVRKLDGAATSTFATSADLPAGTALRGKWMVVTHGRITARFGRPIEADARGTRGVYGTVTSAYEIDRVEKIDGRTWIHLARDHGLRIEGGKATEVFSMWRTYEGVERFVVHTHATTARE
jgi:hypothetical protein